MTDLLSDADIGKNLAALEGWQRREHSIEKTWEFPSFQRAMNFVTAVADIAEEMDHHPHIEVTYTKVTLRISTHSAGGLTGKDFTLARKVDTLLRTR